MQMQCGHTFEDHSPFEDCPELILEKNTLEREILHLQREQLVERAKLDTLRAEYLVVKRFIDELYPALGEAYRTGPIYDKRHRDQIEAFLGI